MQLKLYTAMVVIMKLQAATVVLMKLLLYNFFESTSKILFSEIMVGRTEFCKED